MEIPTRTRHRDPAQFAPTRQQKRTQYLRHSGFPHSRNSQRTSPSTQLVPPSLTNSHAQRYDQCFWTATTTGCIHGHHTDDKQEKIQLAQNSKHPRGMVERLAIGTPTNIYNTNKPASTLPSTRPLVSTRSHQRMAILEQPRPPSQTQW